MAARRHSGAIRVRVRGRVGVRVSTGVGGAQALRGQTLEGVAPQDAPGEGEGEG